MITTRFTELPGLSHAWPPPPSILYKHSQNEANHSINHSTTKPNSYLKNRIASQDSCVTYRCRQAVGTSSALQTKLVGKETHITQIINHVNKKELNSFRTKSQYINYKTRLKLSNLLTVSDTTLYSTLLLVPFPHQVVRPASLSFPGVSAVQISPEFPRDILRTVTVHTDYRSDL